MGEALRDSSNNNFTVYQNGTGLTFNSSDYKFGVSSLDFSTSAAGWLNVSQSNQTDFHLQGTDTYTIHWWMKWTNGNPSAEMDLFSMSNGSQDNYLLRFYNPNNMMWYGDFPTADRALQVDANAANLFNGSWHHVAITQANTSMKIYIDGVNRSPNWTDIGSGSGPSYNNNADFIIGRHEAGPDRYLKGARVEEFEFVKGTRLWTTNFTPPTSAQTPIANTTLLMHFDDINYQIAGTLSDDARVIMIDETSGAIEHDSVHSAGAYSFSTADNNSKLIIAKRSSDAKVLGYGSVTPDTI